jgi:hypothetical protein
MDTTVTGARAAACRSVLLDATPRPTPLGSKPVPVRRSPAVLPTAGSGPKRAGDTLPVAALEDLLTLPGALYACVVRLEDGQVLAEAGWAGAEARAAVRFLGQAVRTALGSLGADPGDRLDDFIVTSSRRYDLVRQVQAIGTASTPMLCLQVDRARGNLAHARQRLAACDLPAARPPSLPRRAPAAVPPPPLLALDAAEPVVPARWANDVTTLRRLRAALRCSA